MIEQLYDSKDLPVRIANARKDIEALQTLDRNKFNDAMYIPQFLIPVKTNADLATFQSNLSGTYDNAYADYQGTVYFGAYLQLMSGIMNFFYRYDFPQDLKQRLVGIMSACNGKPWKEAAEVLMRGVYDLLQIKTDPNA
jgi:hypothetical protein